MNILYHMLDDILFGILILLAIVIIAALVVAAVAILGLISEGVRWLLGLGDEDEESC